MEYLLPWHAKAWKLVQEAKEQGRIPHAMLLTGTGGLGKSRFARYLANSLLCDTPSAQAKPCGTCRSCRLFQANSHPDLKEITPEEAGRQLKVDAIRTLVSQSVLKVQETGYRIFLIDPADAMNPAAANSLLKTLEEPVARTLLVLVSSNPERLPATIRSRCQLVRFPAPSHDQAIEWLLKQPEVEEADAPTLLKIAQGAPLSALNLAQSGEIKSYHSMVKEFITVATGEAEPGGIAGKWKDQQPLEQSMRYLAAWTMDLIKYKNNGGSAVQEQTRLNEGLKRLAKQLDLKTLYSFMDALFEIEYKRGNNLNPQLCLERILIHWNRINTTGVL